MKLKMNGRRRELLTAIQAGQVTAHPDGTVTRAWTDRRGVHHLRTAITSDTRPLLQHRLAMRTAGGVLVLTNLGRRALTLDTREAP